MHKLESTVQSVEPTYVMNVIVDGMLFLHTYPQNYTMAHMSLSQLCQMSSEHVDLVCNTYQY